MVTAHSFVSVAFTLSCHRSCLSSLINDPSLRRILASPVRGSRSTPRNEPVGTVCPRLAPSWIHMLKFLQLIGLDRPQDPRHESGPRSLSQYPEWCQSSLRLC